MSGFYDKLERKFGRYAISNLTLYLICGYIIGYAVSIFAPEAFYFLTLDPYQILHGQIWRLLTWIIAPPSGFGLFTILMLFFYYSIGQTLERVWGAFRYNLYLVSGMLFTVIGAFVAYFVFLYTDFRGTEQAIYGLMSEEMIGKAVSYCITTYYICLSLILAFSAIFPNEEVYLYGILPIKMKWFGIFDIAIVLYDFIKSSFLPVRIIILASLLNFLIFFFWTKKQRMSPRHMKQKQKFREAKKMQPHYKNGARHKCHICGRTELDDPTLEFRYCSKCEGNYEYCQEHLFTHEHIKKG